MAEDTETAEHEKGESVLEEAKERFKLCEEAWAENRMAAIEDMRFRAGDQWPTETKRARRERPCLVVDKLNQFIRQVVNDGRQNRPMVKVRPVDDGADKEAADVFQGLIRHIWDRSNADEAIDSALDAAVVGGFGYFRVLTEYAHENTFNQEIAIGRIRNPLAVLLDPYAMKADGSDARFGFVVDEMSKEQFEKQYPKAKLTNWQEDGRHYGEGWIEGEKVRVCEYWYKIEEPRTLHLLEDGTTIDDDLYQKAKAELGMVPAIKESRDIPMPKVKWCRMSGAEILEEKDWLGKWIPIIPVYGNEYDIEGKVTYSGIVRAAKDAQRLYNYSRSAYAERVALTPKSPYLAPVDGVEEFTDEWETSNVENHAVLRYRQYDDSGRPLNMPTRQPAADIPAGFAQDMQLSEHDIQAAIGMYSASLGQPSNEKSGRAIMARQREGDTGTFHYQDNLSRAIRHLGRILVDLIPKIYDSARVVRILGEDGKADHAQIDPSQPQAVVKIGSRSIYNLNVGTYDVTVEAGPSFTTKRQESAEAMMQMTQAQPQLMQIIGDLMVRAMDWPGAEQMADRLKALLPPQIQQLEQKDKGQSPEVQQVMAQAQQEIDKREQMIQQMDAAIQDMSEKLKELQEGTDLKAQEIQVKAYDAETKRLQVLAPAVPPDLVQTIVMQTLAQLQATQLAPPEQEDGQPMPTMGMEPQESPEGPPMQIPPMAMPDIQQQPPQGGFFSPEGSETNPLAGS